MPQSFITEAVVNAIRAVPGFPNLDVLDLSCGEGEVLMSLTHSGCRAQDTHYRQDDYIIKDPARLPTLTVTNGVDLQRRLPFADAAFDVVVLQEVVEHLENIPFVFREIRRVLKPAVVSSSPRRAC